MSTRPQAALAATLFARREQANADDPDPTLPDKMLRILLSTYANIIRQTPNDRPVIPAAAHCPVIDGQVLLGPEATAVLDGLLAGTVDSLAFFDALTAAIEADLDEVRLPTIGGER